MRKYYLKDKLTYCDQSISTIKEDNLSSSTLVLVDEKLKRGERTVSLAAGGWSEGVINVFWLPRPTDHDRSLCLTYILVSTARRRMSLLFFLEYLSDQEIRFIIYNLSYAFAKLLMLFLVDQCVSKLLP